MHLTTRSCGFPKHTAVVIANRILEKGSNNKWTQARNLIVHQDSTVFLTTPRPFDQPPDPTNLTLFTSLCPCAHFPIYSHSHCFRFDPHHFSQGISVKVSQLVSLPQSHTMHKQLCRDSNHICLLLWNPSDSIRVRGVGESGTGKWGEVIYSKEAKKSISWY